MEILLVNKNAHFFIFVLYYALLFFYQDFCDTERKFYSYMPVRNHEILEERNVI